MIEPVFLSRRSARLGQDCIRAKKANNDIHRALCRRFQQHLFFTRFEIYRYQMPSREHSAGDVSVCVIDSHFIAAPGPVRMARTDTAKVLDHFAQLRIVDVETNLAATGRSRSVKPPIGAGSDWTYFASYIRNDLASILDRVACRIVHVHEHSARFATRGRDDVVFAVETKRSAREIKLPLIRQPLLFHLAGAEIDRVKPCRTVVLLKINLKLVPRL